MLQDVHFCFRHVHLRLDEIYFYVHSFVYKKIGGMFLQVSFGVCFFSLITINKEKKRFTIFIYVPSMEV